MMTDFFELVWFHYLKTEAKYMQCDMFEVCLFSHVWPLHCLQLHKFDLLDLMLQSLVLLFLCVSDVFSESLLNTDTIACLLGIHINK